MHEEGTSQSYAAHAVWPLRALGWAPHFGGIYSSTVYSINFRDFVG